MLTAHVLLTALSATVLAVLLDGAMQLVGLPLVVALWDGALLLAWRYAPRRWEVWRSALDRWLTVLTAASLGLLLLVADSNWAVCTVTLLALAVATLAQGGWQGQPFWLKAGLTLALAGSHTVWLTGSVSFAWTPWIGLAPWYAAQTVLLMLGCMAVRRGLAARLNVADPEAGSEGFNRLYDWERAVAGLMPWLLGLSALWLGAHGYAVLAYRVGWGPSPWHFGIPADPLAASVALLMLAGLTLTRAWRHPDGRTRIEWTYDAGTQQDDIEIYHAETGWGWTDWEWRRQVTGEVRQAVAWPHRVDLQPRRPVGMLPPPDYWPVSAPLVTVDHYETMLMPKKQWSVRAHDRTSDAVVEVQLAPLDNRTWSVHVRMSNKHGSDRSGFLRRVTWEGV